MKSHFKGSIFMEGVSDEERIKFEDAYRLLVRKLSIAGKDKPLLLKKPRVHRSDRNTQPLI